jgi:fructoselysine-6-P-deglycase FrlB-like protein
MSAAKYDINLEQNSDFLVTITVTDGSTPINLTGYTLYSQIRETPSTAILASFTTEIVNAAAGIFQMTLDSSVTKTLPANIGALRYDVIMINGGSQQRLIYGNVNVRDAITVIA